MNRAIILAAVMISAAILVNGYLERVPSAGHGAGKQVAALHDKSIAVLQFANLSEDKSGSHFAEGVREEVASQLARDAQLKVIDPATSMDGATGTMHRQRLPDEMARAAYLLKGSVQRAGNRVRVGAQLIDAGKDQAIWSESYDRELTDVFALEHDIAQTIAKQVRTPLALATRATDAKP